MFSTVVHISGARPRVASLVGSPSSCQIRAATAAGVTTALEAKTAAAW